MYLIIVIIGIAAGIISGMVGTGASIMLLPALAYTFGPKAAVPIMAIAAIMGNVSRVLMWRRDINIRAFLWYSLPGIPAAVLGANTLWLMPAPLSNFCIGLFFFLLIPARHWANARAITLNPMQLALAGALVGYLTGVVFSTGPLTIPLFAGYGLTKGALLSTEAAASFAIYLAKASAFGAIGALPRSVVISGLMVGGTLVAGMYIGKIFLVKMAEKTFNRLIDAMMLVAGASMIWDALN
ncbi:sulfite exporter TauE/SafE family protein [Sodalis sp. C49]|uniref:sulfite exporter TauE/SafE family protein n=1 Tax=unclassified Sodalis (in: enterobacteria) TaxID=2636512 RepID=UPI003965CF2A